MAIHKSGVNPAKTQRANKRPNRIRKRRILIWVSLPVVMVGVAILALVWAAQQTPTFYARLLAIDSESLNRDGASFESKAFDLRNRSRSTGNWSAVFEQSEINGWLGSDLPQKFPRSLPDNVRDPRLELTDDHLKAGCRFRWGWLTVTLVVEADCYWPGQSNYVCVRPTSVRAGWIPLPMDSVANQLTAVLRRNGFEVQWIEESDLPVMKIRLPESITVREDRRTSLTGLAIEDERLLLSGQTTID